MGHHCNYSSELKFNKDNSFYFEITAKYKSKEATVLKINEDGSTMSRYIYLSSIAGYLVTFPGEKLNYYYGYGIQPIENFSKDCQAFNIYIDWKNCPDDLKTIAKKKPELKYLCQKYYHDSSIFEFIKSIHIYKNIGADMEPLIQAGMTSIANNKNLWRMSEEKRHQIMLFIKNNIDDLKKIASDYYDDIKLKDIQKFMKGKYRPKYIYLMEKYGLNYSEIKYCEKKSVEESDYSNYKNAVINVGHNWNQDYWSFPSDFQKKFDKVNLEKNEIQYAKDMISKSKFGNAMNAFEELSKSSRKTIANYLIYIPYDIKDIFNQANKLSQCLVRNNYIEKMAGLESILIFIKDLKTNNPLATAEISWKKELLQIYGDESSEDRNESLVSKELNSIVLSYINKLRLKRPVINNNYEIRDNENIFYKGIVKKGTYLVDMYGKNKYNVGEIYQTGCKDDDFNESCKSTDKAIHFCKDIRKVDNFIGGNDSRTYLLIQALGKVFHKGDEYYSNRIKVLSIINI